MSNDGQPACLMPASPFGTQPCLALQNDPRSSINAPPLFHPVFPFRGSRLSAPAARLSMRSGTLRPAVIRSLLGLFPSCSFGGVWRRCQC